LPADRSDGRASKLSAWIAGIVASCLVAVVGFWVSQHGEDTIAELRDEPALKNLVRVDELSNFDMVFDKGPLSREDYAKLRLSSGAKVFKVLQDLAEDYDGVRAKYFKAQIVLTGGRDRLTVLDIAVRHRINRADQPKAWYLFKGLAQGGNPSAPIAVNLDLQNPLFEMAGQAGYSLL
jgi:hypothetical protein